jgi:predicted Fe-Mo cluster-binding NifX family protein
MLLKIAIPVLNGRLLGHLGETKQFALVEADQQNRVIGRTQIVAAPPHEPGSFPRWLREQGVRVVIAVGIGQRALDNLNHYGIEVWSGQIGAPAKTQVVAWLAGQLTRSPSGCAHQRGEAEGHECQLSDYLKTNQPRRGPTSL